MHQHYHQGISGTALPLCREVAEAERQAVNNIIQVLGTDCILSCVSCNTGLQLQSLAQMLMRLQLAHAVRLLLGHLLHSS